MGFFSIYLPILRLVGRHNTPCNLEQKGTLTGIYGATKKHGEYYILASGVSM